ncbi:DMT family transporter [Aureimonas populi]|uniref:DMT family transporter n=1 Tax=Aureimonas populi TaxID=1701758 RepID=A0ABW5CHL4_9HYPH|nr:DMT family transporter [Aureimonas populi]
MRLIAHPYLFLVLAAIFWGANAVGGKLAVGHVSPMMLNVLRWGMATLLLLPFAWHKLRADRQVIISRLPFLFTMGTCGMALFNAILYTALLHTTAVQAMIVQSAMPLVVFLGMFLFYKVKVLPMQVLGFTLTAAGVLLAAARGDPTALLTLDLNIGDAMMLGAVLLYGGYTVALRLKPPLHWISLIFVLCASAFAAAIPLLLWETATGRFVAPDATGWAIALFTAILPSIAAQVFYIRGVELIGANRANLFVNLVPITGAVMAVAILGEALLPYHFIALALVIGGIMLAERAGRAAWRPAK